MERSQYVYDWPSGYGVAEAAPPGVLRAAAARQPSVVLRGQSSGSWKEGLDLVLRRRAAPIEITDAPMKAGDFTDAVERLILAGRPVVFAVDEAAGSQLVLSLEGRRALQPMAAFPKPDARRQVALYAVAPEDGAPKRAAWSEAEAAFRRALARDGSDAGAHNGLGFACGCRDAARSGPLDGRCAAAGSRRAAGRLQPERRAQRDAPRR